MYERILSTVDFLNQQTNGFQPEVGIVLGSGLGGLANGIAVEYAIPYSAIPNFPISTVKGHQSQLLFGTIAGRKVVAMQGRFHYYEGYTMSEVTFPIRVLMKLGIQFLILSNAAGGLNPNFNVGDIMIITDQIHAMPNPLIGPHDDRLGERFPDMSDPYDNRLIKLADRIAMEKGIWVQHGVYCSTTGPTYETPAECRYFRIIGADTIGMSTTPEVIVARQGKLPVFGLSIVSDMGNIYGVDHPMTITHEEVIKAVNAVEPKLITLITELIRRSTEIQF
ncbi:MAG: purine-nucleoside phosphorylase [Bacteroidales bacterium]|nr:purine-nucleoside phosphorylase [Bacteroidales bacterium]